MALLGERRGREMESVLWRAAGRSAIGGASDGGCSSNDGNSMGEAVVAYFAATFNLPPTILLPLSHRPPVHLQPTYLLLYGALVATGLCNTLLETRHTLTCTGVRRYSRNGRLSLHTHIFHCLAGWLPACSQLHKSASSLESQQNCRFLSAWSV